jgi:signal transduction histidine kinase/ActR/RegA family two-component response regulator
MDELERGRRYRYRIRVPRGGGALARVRRTVSWPFTARAAARELAEAHALLARRYDELEAQVARREQLEQQMLQTQKLESLGVLAGGIAHDFNNLLMSISGNAALAKHHIENNTARGFVSKIETASQRASALTRSLLAYAGKGSLRRERIDLSALAREMSSLLGVGVSAKTRLDYDLADEIWVEGDATQLCQVLMNLVTNAAEALSESGDTIVVSTGRLEVTGPGTCGVLGKELAQGSYVFCEVRDRGSGMSRETQKRIFDPFFTTKSSGRGLGLAAVLGIVASHGGRVMVDSEEGVGTTFRVVLPRAQANDVGQQHDADRVAAWGNSTRLLVVDDDANVAAVTAMLLRTLGFEVTVVDSGQGAVEQFREAPEGYRAVVIDATMPDMDGVTTIAELRRIRDVPVVVMSGHAEEDMTEHLRAHRDVAFLQKPFGLSALDACLRKRLGAETEARVAASGALRRAPH